MNFLKKEISTNFEKFSSALSRKIDSTGAELAKSPNEFLASYERMTSLQAWRSSILEEMFEKNHAYGFILEAQNDLLTSHTLATLGLWRGAHKSLRSLLENLLYFLYYKDHSVEYELWTRGKHWLPFKELVPYFESHPQYLDCDEETRKLCGWTEIKKLYGDLSNSVHGALNSRMTTSEEFPNILTSDLASLGRWGTHEKRTLCCLNKLLIFFFHEKISGTQREGLRKSISLSIGEEKYKISLHEKLGVRLF